MLRNLKIITFLSISKNTLGLNNLKNIQIPSQTMILPTSFPEHNPPKIYESDEFSLLSMILGNLSNVCSKRVSKCAIFCEF